MSEEGKKLDAGKARYDLIQPRALEAYVRVLTYGCRKYSAHNWRLVQDGRSRYIAAALRHLMAYLRGEMFDADSLENHLAHALASIAFVLELDEEDAEREVRDQGGRPSGAAGGGGKAPL